MNSAEPKPRIRCTDPPQAMCGWCRQWDALDNLRVSPAGLGRYHIMLGNTWPIHSACFMEWYDGSTPGAPTLKHPDVVTDKSAVPAQRDVAGDSTDSSLQKRLEK